MYEFDKAVELINTKLGENSTLVQAELKEILAEANSATSRLKEVNNESATRRVEIKTLKDEHAKQIESFGDYDSLKTLLEEKTSQLDLNNAKLSSFYEQRKDVLRKMSADFDFEKDENLKSISSRFKGLENLKTLENDQVEKFIGDFELLTLNKMPSGNNIPNPSNQTVTKETETGRYKFKTDN